MLDAMPDALSAEVDSWPLKLHLQRRRVGNAIWSSDSWSLLGVDSERTRLSGSAPAMVERRSDPDGGAEIQVWTGLL